MTAYAPRFASEHLLCCTPNDLIRVIVVLRRANGPAGRLDDLLGLTRQCMWSSCSCRPSPYHLGATRSIKVIDASHRTMTVILGRCCAVRLLHFAAALLCLPLTLNCQWHIGLAPMPLRTAPYRREIADGIARDVVCWTFRQSWTILALLVRAFLSVLAATQYDHGHAPDGQLIPLIRNEIRRLLTGMAQHLPHPPSS